jgi:hypothetical protein
MLRKLDKRAVVSEPTQIVIGRNCCPHPLLQHAGGTRRIHAACGYYEPIREIRMKENEKPVCEKCGSSLVILVGTQKTLQRLRPR